MSHSFDYGSLANQQIDAIKAFKEVYSQQNPPPVMPSESRKSVAMRIAVIIVLIGSMIVSASHTIPTFVGSKDVNPLTIIIGISAFAMMEAAIFVFEHTRTKTRYRLAKKTPREYLWFVSGGLGTAVGTTVLANIHYLLKATDFSTGIGWDVFTFLITLAVACSAPAMAFISGAVFAMMDIEEMSYKHKADQEYRNEYKKWMEAFQRSWNANKNNWGAAVRVEKPVQKLLSSVSVRTDRQQTDAAQNMSRSSSAVDTAYQWLIDNPDKISLPLRELEEVIGVGKDAIAKAKKRL